MQKKYLPYDLVRNTKTNLLGPDFDLQDYIKKVVNEGLSNGTVYLPTVDVDTATVTDDDNAATTGVAVYFVADNALFGHLEFVSPTNADGSFTVGATGPVVTVTDNDNAATAGVQLYFDEDATAADSRLLAATTTAKDAFVLTSNGELVRIVYNAAPGTPGVALYFDEDGATNAEKLVFVSPTNADGTFTTDDTLTFIAQ